MAGLFQVLWGQADGEFKKAETLKGTDGEPLIIPAADDSQITENICTRPFAVDWDGDGDLDLVVGNFAGGFYLFTGEGKGRFLPKPEPILCGDSPLRINSAHSDPFPVDWDSDGDLDLVSGASEGGVHLAENVAGKGQTPRMKAFVTLIAPGAQHSDGEILREAEVTAPRQDTRVWVDDINQDGKLDVLVGDMVALITPAKDIDEQQFKTLYAEWQSEWKAAVEGLNAAQDDAEKQRQAIERYNDVYRKRSQFMQQEMTGFVWLYLQK